MAFTCSGGPFLSFCGCSVCEDRTTFLGGYALNGSGALKLGRRRGFDSPTTHTI